MEHVDNNQFEIVPNPKEKRKIEPSCSTAYLNPALDLVSNEDPMVNTAMEIVPHKKRKRTKSCDIVAFENSALDLGISKSAVSEFLARELENVRQNIIHESPAKICKRGTPDIISDVLVKDNSLTFCDITMNADELRNVDGDEPIYANVNSIGQMKQSSLTESAADISDIPPIDNETKTVVARDNQVDMPLVMSTQSNSTAMNPINCNIDKEFGDISNITNIQNNVTSNILVNNHTNLSLSFIDRLNLDSPATSNQSLYLDDDLNESNIMEIKTITIITKKKRIPIKKKNTNPFLTDSPEVEVEMSSENPFAQSSVSCTDDMEYDAAAAIPTHCQTQLNHEVANILPRRLFEGSQTTDYTYAETNHSDASHEYENIDGNRSESPVYENVADAILPEAFDKRSKILGYDVSQFTAADIMNLNKMSETTCSTDSNDSKKLKHHFLKASNKLSRKVFKTLKKTFKGEKQMEVNTTLNPYEVPRKLPKKVVSENRDPGIENPGLNIDNSDEIEIEELEDDEHQYETIKTLRNTRLNMNVTPLRERSNDSEVSASRGAAGTAGPASGTPGKRVRFDATLNQEKLITGDSFECVHSPGLDDKIDKFQDELENCINERKFIQQNLN